jgi:hypothetical protein
MNSPVRAQYRRHIQECGSRFEAKQDFESAVRQQCRREFLQARSTDALDRFLRRLAELNGRVDEEIRAHHALARVLSSLDDAVAVAGQLDARAPSAPWAMVSTRSLARMAEELEDFRAALNAQVNLRATDSLSEHGGTARGEEGAFSFFLSSWSSALREVSWAQRPAHRELVFLALQHTGELGSRRSFRFLATASLLSGGEQITFRPNRTTVAEAIGYESKRMREVALQLAPSWAANLPIDESAVEEAASEDRVGFLEWSDAEDQPAGMPPISQAA